MKCTCKDWEDSSEALTGVVLVISHCPWCGSPLLPDPVEKTEWFAENNAIRYKAKDQFEATEIAERHARIYHEEARVGFITTIERTIRVVRPKV
jgi:hypothetical protein